MSERRYVLACRLPKSKDWILGDKQHRTMADVHRQLRRTAPQWRQVFPGVEFTIAEVEES